MRTDESYNTLKLTDDEFYTLSKYVKTNFGIDLTKKRGLIEGRLSGELNRHGFRTFKEYMDFVFNDKSKANITTLLNKLTTNLSYFMRENEHFEYLAQHVLPFLEKERAIKKDLRIWSAGCSTGQEPYNIAMVIDEYFGSRGSKWDTTILATDISTKVLNKAIQGVYPESSLKDMPEHWKSKYFNKIGNAYHVCDSIKSEVFFRPFNLMDPFAFKQPFDLIFCRNVMIYFDSSTKEDLVNKFYSATSNGGYLFIGHSESITNTKDLPYKYIQPAIYQRRG